MEVVTHLFSTTHDHNVRVKVRLPADEPVLPDDLATSIPRRTGTNARPARCSASRSRVTRCPVKLLLPEPFEGHPLRKDFPLMSREAKPWPGAAEGEEEEEE